MKRHFKFCSHCRRSLTEGEMKRGLYVESERGILCATCAQRLDEAVAFAPPMPPTAAAGADKRPSEKPAPAKPKPVQAPPEASPAKESPKPEATPSPLPPGADRHLAALRRLEEQLERIERLLMFERSSFWNVLGAVAQCLAAGLLVVAAIRWLHAPGDLLLAAIIFQVMALTFFVKGK